MSPPHVSPWTGVLFLLEGRITALVDGTSYDVEPGGLVVFPAGTPSTFEVVGESARFLAITSGDGAGRFFADFAGSVPADQPVEDSMAAILSVTKRHGVALAGAELTPSRTRSEHDRIRSVAATGGPDDAPGGGGRRAGRRAAGYACDGCWSTTATALPGVGRLGRSGRRRSATGDRGVRP